jgi:hypothetical protein
MLKIKSVLCFIMALAVTFNPFIFAFADGKKSTKAKAPKTIEEFWGVYTGPKPDMKNIPPGPEYRPDDPRFQKWLEEHPNSHTRVPKDAKDYYKPKGTLKSHHDIFIQRYDGDFFDKDIFELEEDKWVWTRTPGDWEWTWQQEGTPFLAKNGEPVLRGNDCYNPAPKTKKPQPLPSKKAQLTIEKKVRPYGDTEFKKTAKGLLNDDFEYEITITVPKTSSAAAENVSFADGLTTALFQIDTETIDATIERNSKVEKIDCPADAENRGIIGKMNPGDIFRITYTGTLKKASGTANGVDFLKNIADVKSSNADTQTSEATIEIKAAPKLAQKAIITIDKYVKEASAPDDDYEESIDDGVAGREYDYILIIKCSKDSPVAAENVIFLDGLDPKYFKIYEDKIRASKKYDLDKKSGGGAIGTLLPGENFRVVYRGKLLKEEGTFKNVAQANASNIEYAVSDQANIIIKDKPKPQPAKVEKKKKRFYETWWFRTLVVVGAGGAVYAATRGGGCDRCPTKAPNHAGGSQF